MSGARLPPPPGPGVVRSLLDLRAARRDLLDHLLATTDAYGDVVRLRFGLEEYVVVRLPEHVRHVMQRRHESYSRRTRAYDLLRLVEGHGLARIDGAPWRARRRMEQPLFRHEAIAAWAETMTDATSEMLARWEGSARRGETVDVAREASRLTLRIIGATMFGAELADDAETIWGLLELLQREIIRRTLSPVDLVAPATRDLPTPKNRAFREAIAELDRVVARIVAARRARPGGAHDLLGMLLAATADDGSALLTDRQIRDEVVGFMIAGHETTATALTWTWHQLSTRPEVERRMAEEAARVLGKRTPTAADAAALSFTRAVFLESMRIIPPVWLKVNRCEADDVIGGFRIAAGSIVLISPYLTHRVPTAWKNPEAFDPDRFLAPGTIDPFAYIPFGGGPHVCIGREFATLEAQLILSMVASRFALHVRPGHRARLDPNVTLRPLGGMPMTLHEKAVD